MLTADLVEVRRRGTDLSLRPLTADERAFALDLAQTYLALIRAHIGRTRGQLAEAARLVVVPARLRKLAQGLWKLALDRCEFTPSVFAVDPPVLRAELFRAAVLARRELGPRADFDRTAVIAAQADRHGTTAPAIESALYADLPDAELLMSAALGTPLNLVAAYEAGGAQAILLRAVSVRARVTSAAPAAYRDLFRKLKFLRLLHQIEPLPPPARARKGAPPPGYLITIDGPYSLFESVTRYGLALALAYPAIAACGRWEIEADLRWGHDRRALRFVQRGEAGPPDGAPVAPPAEISALLGEAARLTADFDARPCERLISLPGAGVIAPDLELVERTTGRQVLVELLGFWSRDAVWRRIELAEKGLAEPIVFAVSKHLRVSEAALPETTRAALYVYATKPSLRALAERAQELLARTPLTEPAPAAVGGDQL